MLCPTVLNQLTSTDGPCGGHHGHFSSRSIKPRLLPASATRGDRLGCATWGTELHKGRALLLWSVLWQYYVDNTWLMVLGENFFCHPVTRSGCLFGPTSLRAKNMPLQGEKVMTIRRRFASRGTWELFENSSAGNSLLRFCMWRTGKSLVIYFFFFLHTVCPNKQFFLVYY